MTQKSQIRTQAQLSNFQDIHKLLKNGQLRAKKLEGSEILAAKKLLYKVYIEECQWEFPKDNLSGIRVEQHKGQAYLEDDFSEVSEWLGLYFNNQLIACVRLLDRLNDKFEVEHYQAIPNYLKKETLTVECNRLAVPSLYQGTGVGITLSAFIVKHLLKRKTKSLLATAPIPGLGNYYMRVLGLKPVDMPAFKYNDDEKEFVHLLHLNIADVITNRKQIQGLIEGMT